MIAIRFPAVCSTFPPERTGAEGQGEGYGSEGA